MKVTHVKLNKRDDNKTKCCSKAFISMILLADFNAVTEAVPVKRKLFLKEYNLDTSSSLAVDVMIHAEN